MSNRQKSFFDQDHTHKANHRPRPNWNRTRSADHVLQTHKGNANNNMAGPAIDASTQAKSKLKAFQFIEGEPGARITSELNKENEMPCVPQEQIEQAGRHEDGKETSYGSYTVTAPVKALPPSTPATRLPLADLIGIMDDSVTRISQHTISPGERIQWQQGGNDATPNNALKRKRKRARSSSPATSSPNEASTCLQGHSETFDLQNLNKSLKTPQADPALDLWSRYAVGEDSKTTPSAAKEPTFAHLIDKSSPHSSATAGSISGLRRWASCGIEWPSATKPKKRRTTGAFRDGKMSTANDIDESGLDSVDKGSKVGRLVERIQETLGKAAAISSVGDPSSSSPLPETGKGDAPDGGSPLQRLAPSSENEFGSSPAIRSATGDVITTAAVQKSPQSSSSEFGDVDIDMDMVETIESQSRPRTADGSKVQFDNTLSQEETNQTVHTLEAPQVLLEKAPKQQKEKRNDDFDEFDEDGDVFAADMEFVASMYDAQLDATGDCTAESNNIATSQPSTAGDRTDAHETTADAPNGESVIKIDSDDDFGDDEIDVEQFVAAEAVATQRFQAAEAGQAYSEHQLRAIQRYRITKIVEGHYKDDRDRLQPEKVLLVEEEKTDVTKAITLRQAWFDTPCTEGSYVHVIGQFSVTGECFIDNSQNILVLHPDHLLSATVVADSFHCIRKAVLQDRVKTTSDASPPTLYGHILHELFQEALKVNVWQSAALEDMIRRILPRHFETMAEINLNENQVLEHLRSKIPEMQSWAAVFIRSQPSSDSKVKDRNDKQVTLSINKLLDLEEYVWSPKYGLKGKIDATVQVRMADEDGPKTLTVPFELKTGKRTSEAHQAQTMLYTLLTSDRYDLNVFYGILYYLETSEVRRIPAVRHELLHMIMKRNELACYVRERLQLPPVLNNSHQCGKCYAQTSCFIYHKLMEDGDGSTFNARAKDNYDELVRRLDNSHRDFFSKWDRLLTKEESEMMKFRRELWTMLSHEREKLGRCFAHVIIEPGSAAEHEGGKINRFEYTLVKHKPRPGFSFAESQLTVGEPVVVSDEMGHFALANGYVTKVRRKRITVAVDHRLQNTWVRRPGFDAEVNQDFVGIMQVSQSDGEPSTHPSQDDLPPVVYRLDKDEFSNGMATVRNNLISIMDDSIYKASELRSLIIEDRAPTFKNTPSTNPLPQSTSLNMNNDQEAAIAKVMAAQDYALVLGMPGTGKTTTIAHIIRALVAKGKSVLLTSYTHTAVDNILLKIRNSGFPILRLGAIAKVHPDVQDFAILAAKPKDTLEEVINSWHSPPVVATTCLGINHSLFSQRTFDYCIVDEASQITLPVCLGPIRIAKTFILVGDHYQLPPLVQNKEALEGGLDISLFRMLSERHPEAVTSLEHQYRMAEDVMLLSNRLIYSGRLKCGNESVANRALHIPYPGAVNALHHGTPPRIPPSSARNGICRGVTSPDCHLAQIVKSSRKVIFFNTDPLLPAAGETLAGGTRIVNALEARLTTQCVYTLLASGVPSSDVGVITFYRSQLALLKQSFRQIVSQSSSPAKRESEQHISHDASAVEMHTADKFQGRDKEAIIVSFVRSNDTSNVGDLLKDWRRVNVAVTRARSKLVLIGSKKTLASGGDDVLKGLVSICEEKGWMINLGIEALDGHVAVDGGGSQVEATGRLVADSPSPTVKRKSLAQASPLQGQKLCRSSPILERSSQIRRALGEIRGHNSSPPKLRAGMKVPEKLGRLSSRSVLKGRGVLKDLFNDAM